MEITSVTFGKLAVMGGTVEPAPCSMFVLLTFVTHLVGKIIVNLVGTSAATKIVEYVPEQMKIVLLHNLLQYVSLVVRTLAQLEKFAATRAVESAQNQTVFVYNNNASLVDLLHVQKDRFAAMKVVESVSNRLNLVRN